MVASGRSGLGAGGRRIGVCGQPGGARGVHLGRTATAHGHGQGAVVAQKRHDGVKVDGRLRLAHRGQVNQDRVVVKKARSIGHGLGQFGSKLRGVGGLEHHGHHGQRGAFEIKAGAGRRRRFKGHGMERYGKDSARRIGARMPRSVP